MLFNPINVLQPSAWELPASLGWILGMKDLGLRLGRDRLIANIRSHFEKSTTPILCFPEGTTTSGKVGLLR